jgi:transcriptional/translational regulatory protein YebC/TACO1
MTKAEEGYAISTDPSLLSEVREALEKAGYLVVKTEMDMIPKTTVSINSPDDAAKILKLMDALEDHDDVQKVYANFDIPDEILEGMAG